MSSQPSPDNVAVVISCELGRRNLTLREARSLKEQDVIELAKLAGESFDVRVNGRVFAQGEVVIVTERVAVRLTSLAEPPQEDPR